MFSGEAKGKIGKKRVYRKISNIWNSLFSLVKLAQDLFKNIKRPGSNTFWINLLLNCKNIGNLKDSITTFRSSHPAVFLRNGCSENMQQICRRTPMPKCDLQGLSCTNFTWFILEYLDPNVSPGYYSPWRHNFQIWENGLKYKKLNT